MRNKDAVIKKDKAKRNAAILSLKSCNNMNEIKRYLETEIIPRLNIE